MSHDQGKYWLLTHYDVAINYDTQTDPFWTSKNIIFSKGQLERCPTTERLHWQFIVCFKRKVRRRTVKIALGDDIHAELSNSPAANDYVHKEETSMGRRWEFGRTPHKQNSEVDWEVIWNCAKSGDIENIPANVRVNSYNAIRRIQMDFMKPEGVQKEVKVYWGPTGVGKSRKAWEEAGLDAYPKGPTTKFWDGYQGQENVVIDEFFGQIEVLIYLIILILD